MKCCECEHAFTRLFTADNGSTHEVRYCADDYPFLPMKECAQGDGSAPEWCPEENCLEAAAITRRAEIVAAVGETAVFLAGVSRRVIRERDEAREIARFWHERCAEYAEPDGDKYDADELTIAGWSEA